MINKEELERIAKIKGLSIKNAERDYLLELLLFVLYDKSTKLLVFKGGTALYKLYSLNRFSEDLDFTLNASRIEINNLFTKVIKKLEDNGVSSKLKEINDYQDQMNIKVELRGPLFDGNPKNLSLININISLKERTIYKAEQRKIFSYYQDIPAFDVYIMPLNEIFAEKIRAIFTRNKARDVYDLWFLLNKRAKLIIKDANKKLKKYKLSFSLEELNNKINEKEKMWRNDLNGIIIGTLPDFSLVKNEIFLKIKNTAKESE